MGGHLLSAGRHAGVRERRHTPAAGGQRCAAVTAVLGGLLLATGACSGDTAGDGGPAASCAVEITIAGVTYIAGRGGEGAMPVPHTGTVLHGTTRPCTEPPGSGSAVPGRPAIAHTIPGVHVADAVAGPGGYEVMVAEPLWQQPWAALPPELQPYVRR